MAGPGFGGSCFAEVILSLIHTAKTFDEDNEAFRAGVRINGVCVRSENAALSITESSGA
ncbi:hypothetical protein LLG95_07050 [bacterium]|nr:hypothetical protein [bacterium]